MRFDIAIDFFAPDTKERPDDLEFRSRNPARSDLAHSAETRRAGAAKQVHQKSLNEIIRVMPEKDCVASATPGGFRKKLVTRHASRCFQRLPGLAGKRGNICSARLKLTLELRGQAFDEFRIGLARASAQLMIEMADDEPPIAKIVELMQKRDRIAPAGDADEVCLVRRKLLENLQLETDGALFGLAASCGLNVEALARERAPTILMSI